MLLEELGLLPMQRFDPERMKSLRKAAGLTQAEAAKAAGMTQGQWSQIESGTRGDVMVGTLAEVATVLRCDVRDLITDPTPPKAKGRGK